jgi:hypothetical protein
VQGSFDRELTVLLIPEADVRVTSHMEDLANIFLVPPVISGPQLGTLVLSPTSGTSQVGEEYPKHYRIESPPGELPRSPVQATWEAATDVASRTSRLRLRRQGEAPQGYQHP